MFEISFFGMARPQSVY